MSSRFMIDSTSGWRGGRPAQLSGAGTSGMTVHTPSSSSSRVPSAALTVRISVSATWPTTRAWVTWRPWAAIVTSTSRMDGGTA
jgi:hypothetical protein